MSGGASGRIDNSRLTEWLNNTSSSRTSAGETRISGHAKVCAFTVTSDWVTGHRRTRIVVLARSRDNLTTGRVG